MELVRIVKKRNIELHLALYDSLGKATLMKSLVVNFLKNESGATAIEYGLIASLIAVVIIAALTMLGTKLSNTFKLVAAQLR